MSNPGIKKLNLDDRAIFEKFEHFNSISERKNGCLLDMRELEIEFT